MSGGLIIQDGKIVGAVTHVLVNDPAREVWDLYQKYAEGRIYIVVPVADGHNGSSREFTFGYVK